MIRKKVRVDATELAQFAGNPAMQQKYVLTRLRNAGFPINGMNFLVSLTNGKMSIHKKDNGYDYEWIV